MSPPANSQLKEKVKTFTVPTWKSHPRVQQRNSASQHEGIEGERQFERPNPTVCKASGRRRALTFLRKRKGTTRWSIGDEKDERSSLWALAATDLTWIRHLLTSLAHRALLQPEVSDNPERKRSSRAVATAGRIVWPGLILTAHQRGTANTYVNTTHRTGTQRANKHKFHLQHSIKGGGRSAETPLVPNYIQSLQPELFLFPSSFSSWPCEKVMFTKRHI